MKVTLHPGFHKTGTSSLQAVLRTNRRRLAPFAEILLLGNLRAAVAAATRFAQSRDAADLLAFRAGFTEAIAPHRAAPALILSCEGLSGRTPGKLGIADYRAALPLCQAMAEVLEAAFGADLDLTLVFTTRAPAAWLHSAWRHNLAGYRVTDGFEDWSARYADAAAFGRITEGVEALLPGHRVLTLPMEAAEQDRIGPAGPFLRQAGVPQRRLDRLGVAGLHNAGPDAEVAEALLALNRSNLGTADLKAAKAALLAQT